MNVQDIGRDSLADKLMLDRLIDYLVDMRSVCCISRENRIGIKASCNHSVFLESQEVCRLLTHRTFELLYIV